MRKLFLIKLILIFSTIFSKDYIIKEIDINEINRTRYNTVLKIIDLKSGDLIDESEIDSVKQKLLSTGIFQNDINVKLIPVSDIEANLLITLKERWTLIPIPVVVITSDNWLAGGVFIESNLLGLNQTLVAGTFVNSDNFSGFAAWSNPVFLDSSYSFGLSTSFYGGSKEYLNVSGDELLASYNEKRLSLSVTTGKEVVTNLSWNYSTGIEGFEASKSTGYLYKEDFSTLFWKNRISLVYNNLYYKNFFNEGFLGKIESNIYSTVDYPFNPTMEIKLYKNTIIPGRTLLKAQINGGVQNSLKYKPIFIGGREGSRALPSSEVPVINYADFLISFEPVVFKPSWGIFTAPIYYEAGILTNLKSEQSSWHGPGMGFRFYVDKVAIPALGADFTWDLKRGNFKVAFSIGGAGGN